MAGIAFSVLLISSLALLRISVHRIGAHEDRFFATVFLGSGLLFVGMMFVAAAVAGGLIADMSSSAPPGADTLALGRNVTSLLLNVYSMRMAAVFTLTTVTIARRTKIVSRWVTAAGLATALVLLVGIGITPWAAVAVTGAAGGYAIQLARARGLTVIADAPPHGEGIVRALGADHVVARGDRFVGQVRGLSPAGVPGLVDGANLDGAALGAIADGGTIVTLRSWRGLAERGNTVRPISAAEAHRRLAAGGRRGRIVLDFETPLT